MKICIKCRVAKPTEDFYIRILKTGFSRRGICKKCHHPSQRKPVEPEKLRRQAVGTSLCTKCGKEKPIDCFHKNLRNSSGIRADCKVCALAYRAKRYRDNPEKAKGAQYRYNYNLTLPQLSSMVAKQNNQCAICEQDMKPPCVDHNHHTGQNRGLLCRVCNSAIGKLKDSPALLRRALEYLEHYEKAT